MINERLRELRRELKISQREFGSRIGLSQTHIASLETGVRKITERITGDICWVFGVRKDWLTGGEPPMFADLLAGLVVSEDVRGLADYVIKQFEHISIKQIMLLHYHGKQQIDIKRVIADALSQQ